MKKTTIIAEAGVNHNGYIENAFKLVDIASEAGADYIKFQTFQASELIDRKTKKADYQKAMTDEQESQYEMLKRLELPFSAFEDLFEYSNKKNIKFMSTAFDQNSLEFLNRKLGMSINKIPSGEITNSPFLLEHAKSKNNLILSTGMSTISEIEDALSVIAFGFLNEEKKPSIDNFNKAYQSAEGKRALKEKVTLLHCTSEYPAPNQNLNLLAMNEIKKYFDLKVGYSDHSIDIDASIIAVSMGARVIEKHFTIDKTMDGPDHAASLNPEELSELIRKIRDIETIKGNSEKKPTRGEIKNKKLVRKSIVAKGTIYKGDLFSEKNLSVKRPGNGISPMRIWDILGKKSTREYQHDEQIIE